MNVKYTGHLQKYDTWTEHKGWGLAQHYEAGEVLGGEGDKVDISSRMSLGNTRLVSSNISGELQEASYVRDLDGKANLKVEVSDQGDVVVKNPGREHTGELIFTEALPKSCVDRSRQSIERAESRGPISQVEVNWSDGYIRLK